LHEINKDSQSQAIEKKDSTQSNENKEPETQANNTSTALRGFELRRVRHALKDQQQQQLETYTSPKAKPSTSKRKSPRFIKPCPKSKKPRGEAPEEPVVDYLDGTESDGNKLLPTDVQPLVGDALNDIFSVFSRSQLIIEEDYTAQPNEGKSPFTFIKS
jgi:hypothetical protein